MTTHDGYLKLPRPLPLRRGCWGGGMKRLILLCMLTSGCALDKASGEIPRKEEMQYVCRDSAFLLGELKGTGVFRSGAACHPLADMTRELTPAGVVIMCRCRRADAGVKP